MAELDSGSVSSSYWDSGVQLGVMRVVIVVGISCFYAPTKKMEVMHLKLHTAD